MSKWLSRFNGVAITNEQEVRIDLRSSKINIQLVLDFKL
jgi:hypothetical protein